MRPRTAAPQGLLEINQRPINDLKALIELIGQRRVERELNVHRTTVRRWLQGTVAMPGAQRLAVQRQEIVKLKARVALAESAMPDAANDPRAGLIAPHEVQRQA